MTGKDLIAYISTRDLFEQPILHNGRFLDFLTVEEVAAKFEVGVATVYVWYEFGLLDGVKIGDHIYVPQTAGKPNVLDGEDLDSGLLTYLAIHKSQATPKGVRFPWGESKD